MRDVQLSRVRVCFGLRITAAVCQSGDACMLCCAVSLTSLNVTGHPLRSRFALIFT